MLLFAGVASAQDDKVEVFGGYSYVRADQNLFGTVNNLNFNGGSGSVAYNVIPWVGIVADFGGYHWNGSGIYAGEDGTAVSYMFGPKVSMHLGHVTPFVQSLYGGTHLSGQTCEEGDGGGVRVHPEGTPSCSSGSANAFSMTIGGGVDWDVTHHLGVRLVQAEYYMTRFGSETQNNLRLSAGVTFRF
jgi:opacity protein-like surface antigen